MPRLWCWLGNVSYSANIISLKSWVCYGSSLALQHCLVLKKGVGKLPIKLKEEWSNQHSRRTCSSSGSLENPGRRIPKIASVLSLQNIITLCNILKPPFCFPHPNPCTKLVMGAHHNCHYIQCLDSYPVLEVFIGQLPEPMLALGQKIRMPSHMSTNQPFKQTWLPESANGIIPALIGSLNMALVLIQS